MFLNVFCFGATFLMSLGSADPNPTLPFKNQRIYSISDMNNLLGLQNSTYNSRHIPLRQRRQATNAAVNLFLNLQTMNLATPAPNVPRSVGQSCTDDTNCSGVGALCRPNSIPNQGQLVVNGDCSQIVVDNSNRASKVCNCVPNTQTASCSLSRSAIICV